MARRPRGKDVVCPCHDGEGGNLGGGADFGLAIVPDLVPPDVLVIMPWPADRHGTDRFLGAIYGYLRSIPCVAGVPIPGDDARFGT